jgi:hypothetical protein
MSPEPTKKAAAKSTAKPAKAPAKTTAKATAKTTAKTTAKAASKSTGKAPAKATAKAPAPAPAKAAVKAPAAKKTGGAAKKAAPAQVTAPVKAPAKAKAKAKPKVEEVVEPVHTHDDHDHDDHDHEDHEPTPEEQAQAEADVETMARALAALEDDVLRRALADMSEKNRVDVANQLQLPRATMSLGDALMPLVRRKLQTAAPDHQLQVLFSLAQHANDETIEALGPRAEEPTREDLLEVLPDIIERHGAPLVTLMLAGYTASDALCRPVMRELLETDDRFVIGAPVVVEARPELAARPAPTLSVADLEAKREQRRAAKEAKRAAQIKAREARITAQEKRRQAVHDAKRKTR